MGYSVSDWARDGATSGETISYSDAFQRARSRWGGGKFLTRAELSEFLDLLLSLQGAMDTAADFLFNNLPEDVRCRQRIYEDSQEDIIKLCSRKGGE